MIAVLALHHAGHFVGIERLAGVLKLRDHRAGGEAVAVRVAALAGVLVVLLHELVKQLHALFGIGHGLDLRRDLLGLLLLGGLFVVREGSAAVVRRLEEDVLCRHVVVGINVFLHVLVGDVRAVLAEELAGQAVIEILRLGEILEQVQIHVVRLELFVQLGLGAVVAHDVLNGLVDRVLHVLLARRVKRHVVFRCLDLDEVVPGDVVDDALGHDVAVRLTRALIVGRAPVRDLHAVALHVRHDGAQEIGILVPVHGAAVDGHDLFVALVSIECGSILVGRCIAALFRVAAHAGRGAAGQAADGHHERQQQGGDSGFHQQTLPFVSLHMGVMRGLPGRLPMRKQTLLPVR